MTDWKKKELTLAELRRSAFEHRQMTSSFTWLQSAGFVPKDVTSMPIRQALVDLDPNAIRAGYLASSAYEWDQWGPASPTEFIRAISKETRGSMARDLIFETLMSLGREMKEAIA